jgi:K+-transporting ATPase ATPase C chain
MRRDITRTIIVVLATTIVLGLAYPLAMTGIAQLAFPSAADGSLVKRDGKVVGSRLLGQDFRDRPGYFQSRPSQTDYAADASAFSNAGPNSRALRDALIERAKAYVAREGRDNPGLDIARVPVDAVTTSASGLDPHISLANARIQAARVARVRGLPLQTVLDAVGANTDGRALDLFGDPGVNVLELNLALDRKAP